MRKLLLSLLAVLFLALLPQQTAEAWSLFGGACKGEAAKSSTCVEASKQSKEVNPVAKLIGQAANLIALVAGFVAVFMIIVSGFRYVTAGGSAGGQRAGDAPNNAKKAQSTLVGAIIGLVIIALAWTIIRLVTDNVLK